MKLNARIFFTMSALAVAGSFFLPRTAAAATAIAIDGIVYDSQGSRVSGVTVVAFCGGQNFRGGSGATDGNGRYHIATDSDRCPLGTELTVTTDINGDGLSDGATFTQTHSSTFISIHLGRFPSVAVPEFGGLGGGVAALVGLGIMGFVRRARFKKLQN